MRLLIFPLLVLIGWQHFEYDKAISLLEQAILIDSNYFTAYRNKLSFQIVLKDYNQALKTAIKISQLRPSNPDYYVTIGLLYEIQGDSVSSKKQFIEAEKQYDKMLDTITLSNKNYNMLLMDKAINLIYLGEQQKGNDILKQLYNDQKESSLKEMLASYINKSKGEIIKMLMTPETTTVEALPNNLRNSH